MKHRGQQVKKSTRKKYGPGQVGKKRKQFHSADEVFHEFGACKYRECKRCEAEKRRKEGE